MFFTYKEKGPATVLMYPSNQRPMTKYDITPNIPGKPNPIKEWRKQLKPSISDNFVQSNPTIQALENSVKTSTDMNLCKAQDNIYFLNDCKGVDSSSCVTGSFQIRRSASTVINKQFCWNSKQYLQSRCKTFDQNQTLGAHVDGNNYLRSSCVTYTDISSGDLTYNGDNFNSKIVTCNSSNNPIIYKPNNRVFKQQGGVSSSSRIARLKYDTIRNSTNKYDSLSANLDSSSHILNRKPVPCRGWRPRGKRPFSATDACIYTLNSANM